MQTSSVTVTLSADITITVKNWSLPSDSFNIPGFRCIQRNDNEMQHSPVGSTTFICETIKGELIMQTYKRTSTGHAEASIILYKDTFVVFAYISPKVTLYTLSDVLQNIFESCDTSQMILVKDFNINFKNCSSICKLTDR
jgi:hypothetical protein